MSQASPAITRPAGGGLLRAAAIALVLAVAVNQIIRFIAVAVLNPDPAFMPLTWWQPAAMFTVIGVIGAVIVYALLRRFTRDPDRTFRTVALVGLLLSFIPNILTGLNPEAAPAPGVTWPNIIALMLMHIPPAYFSVRFLTNRS